MAVKWSIKNLLKTRFRWNIVYIHNSIEYYLISLKRTEEYNNEEKIKKNKIKKITTNNDKLKGSSDLLI